jgi:Na+/proline symporter
MCKNNLRHDNIRNADLVSYKAYIQPKATPKQLIFVSHIMICVFGLTMSVFACIWNAASIDLGWLFL